MSNAIGYPVPSLHSLLIDYVANNLHCMLNETQVIASLPDHIKNRILHKFTLNLHFWRKRNFKTILQCLININTKHINLTHCVCVVTDDLLPALKICHNLKELYLTESINNSITTQGLIDLFPHLKKLCMLRLSRCTAVNDKVISSIVDNCPKLAGLELHSCLNISDDALYILSHLENLLWVTLSDTKISDSGITALVKGPSGCKLKELRLADCPNLTGIILNIISCNCPDLEVFAFNGCKMIQNTEILDFTPKGLKQIQYSIEW